MFMRVLTNIARVLVGVLFIISGLVKANDPNGLAIKMTEFFNIWNMTYLNSFALGLAIFMIIFEVFAGVALLLGYKIQLFSTLTLALIIFFTFLTGYAYFTGKPATCGCFGDCIPITSKQSFTKDLILLALVLLIFAYSFYIKPLFSTKTSLIILLLTFVGTVCFIYYVLRNLPVKDCLGFKNGTNLLVAKYGNEGAVKKDKFDENIFYIYKKAGSQDSLKIPAPILLDSIKGQMYAGLDDDDVTSKDTMAAYKFLRVDTILPEAKKTLENSQDNPLYVTMRKGLQFKNTDNEDVTKQILSNDSTQYLLFVKDFFNNNCQNQAINALVKAAGSKQVFIVTIDAKILNASKYPGVGLLSTNDDVVVKAIARSSATLVVLKQGVIVNKYGCASVANALK
jgi:uncharacterized membrane protein YphA (DoxX/SURF4 family)